MFNNDELRKHPAGCYFQTIPVDMVTGLAAIPYDRAEEYGFFKIDFLHLSVLDSFRSKKQMRELLKQEPNWEILKDQEQYTKLFQISKHYQIVSSINPTSIRELADCIAIIRPGKRQFKQTYLKASKKERLKMRDILYTKPLDGGYYFKKSHAHAYALTIVLQLHLIEQNQL